MWPASRGSVLSGRGHPFGPTPFSSPETLVRLVPGEKKQGRGPKPRRGRHLYEITLVVAAGCQTEVCGVRPSGIWGGGTGHDPGEASWPTARGSDSGLRRCPRAQDTQPFPRSCPPPGVRAVEPKVLTFDQRNGTCLCVRLQNTYTLIPMPHGQGLHI